MLAKYGSIQLLGRFLPGIIGFFVAAMLTRLLAPTEFGIYGLALALSRLVALAGFGWLGLTVTRLATGRAPEARFSGSVLALFGVLAGTVAAFGIAALLLPIAAQAARLAAASAFGCVVFAYFDLRSSFFTAAFAFLPLLFLNLVRAAAMGAVTLLVAHLGGSGLDAFLAACAAMLVVTALWPRRGLRPTTLAVDGATIRRICIFGLPIAGSLTLFAISGWADRLVLDLASGAAAVGFYAAAAFIIQNTLQFAAQAIGSVAYPLAVLAYESGDRLACNHQLAQNFVALFGFLLPAALGLSLLIPNIAAVMVGAPYREAVIALTPLLAAAAVITAIRGNFVDHSFQLTGTTWHYMAISADMMAVNIAALLLLVPHLGYMGAGAATLLTDIAGLVHALIAARRVYRLPFPAREIGKVVAASLAMTVALSLVLELRGTTALLSQVGLGAGVYAAAAYGLNLLNVRGATSAMLLRWRAAR